MSKIVRFTLKFVITICLIFSIILTGCSLKISDKPTFKEVATYDRITSVVPINGEPAFLAQVKKGKYSDSSDHPEEPKWIVVFNGNELGVEYDNVLVLKSVDHKIYYEAMKNGEKYVVYDGIVQNEDQIKDLEWLLHHQKIFAKHDSNSPWINTVDSRKRSIVIYDGKTYGQGLKIRTDSVKLVNGTIAFIVQQNYGFGYVWHDGKKYGEGKKIKNFWDVNGSIAIQYYKDNEDYNKGRALSINGNRVSDKTEDVIHAGSVNGKLVYASGKSHLSGGARFVKYNGNKYGPYVEIIRCCYETNGKATYLNRRGITGPFEIIMDGKVVKKYDKKREFIFIRDSLAFTGKDGLRESLWYKGHVIRNFNIEDYNGIFAIGDKLAIVIKKGDKHQLLIEE